MQTILGSGGDIGRLLAEELTAYTDKIRLAARHPKPVTGREELVVADLLREEDVFRAVAGSEIAYLTVGLPYDLRVWEQQWPRIMRHVIDACIAHGCKLVFFDNIYMYDRSAIPDIREDSPINPPSRKGRVRAGLVQMIGEATDKRGLQALIARSADFYGPGAANGMLNILVTDNLRKGKKPNWQCDVNRVHSMTFTPDAAKGTAMLGNTPSAYNQVWHLPTSPERLTGRQLIETACRIAGKKPAWTVLSPWMIRIAGIFSRRIGELYEMQYQNNQDYFFNSEKFNRAFQFIPTTYEAGIRRTMSAP